MSSPAQIAANQQNAQLSTGPRTPQGIENSKHNATRHGLTGKQIVIKGEDPALYDAIRLNLLQQYSPATETEAILVDEAAQNYWRLQRARRVEAQVIEKFGAVDCILNPEAAKAFQRITRYLNAAERSWRRATTQLDNIQAARAKQAAEAAKAENLRVSLSQRVRFAASDQPASPASQTTPPPALRDSGCARNAAEAC